MIVRHPDAQHTAERMLKRYSTPFVALDMAWMHYCSARDDRRDRDADLWYDVHCAIRKKMRRR